MKIKNNILIFIILLLSGCAMQSENTSDRFDNCWLHTVSDYGNKLTLCAREEIATFEVYFPNPGYEPTTCVQTGPVEKIEKDAFVADLNEGTCANNRKLGKTTFTCEKISTVSMVCTDQFGKKSQFEKPGA